MNMRGALAALALLCLSGALPAKADTWALLIGINDYEDRNHISSLGTADQDAKALQKTLTEALAVPERNIELMTSDGMIRPTRSNILQALARLKRNVKEGDTVYVFFSGHGIRIGTADFLLPYDFSGADAETGKETALAESLFYEGLTQVKARAIILTWDKCRNDPFGKAKGIKDRNTLDESAVDRGWKIVPADGSAPPAVPKNAPQILVKFFACSPGQSAYEWRSQGRGYFSYYFEKGLRGAAAANGKVTVGSLKKYVENEVQAQVMRDESEDQTPYPEVVGPGADDFILSGTPTETPEGTPASTAREPVPPSAPPTDLKKETISKKVARIIVETNVPNLKVTLNGSVMVSGISETTFRGRRIVGVVHDFQVTDPIDVDVEATAAGYQPYRVRMPLLGGTVRLARFTDPELPPIAAPTKTLSQPENVRSLLEAHKLDTLTALGALQFQVTPPRLRKVKLPPVIDFVADLNSDENTLLTPLWQVLVAMRDGKVSYSQKGKRLLVTGDSQSWEIEIDKEGRIDRLILPAQKLKERAITLRILKYKDFEGVPLPQQFQAEIEGKTGVFNVKTIAHK